VPAATFITPHWPDTQLRVWQSASVPGQVLVVRHSTQWEAPSHTRLPPQFVPDWTLRWVGVPALHSSVVQGLSSTGLSLSSLTTCAVPLPSHCWPLQSFAVGSTSFVPAAVNENPQTPPVVQVRVLHGVSEPGQSVATAQPTHCPFALQVFAPPQLEPAGIIVWDGVPVVQTSFVQGSDRRGRRCRRSPSSPCRRRHTPGACSRR
jgi:hypothetical protein